MATEPKDLEQFDALKAELTEYVAPALFIQVNDAGSSEHAITAAKGLKELLARVEKRRKETVTPLNDRVASVNDYVKSLIAPLKNAEEHVRNQLNSFAVKQEALRQAEIARIAREKDEAERQAKEERERQQEELRVKQESEAEAAAEAANLFGGGETPVDFAQLNQKLEAEWAAKNAELDTQDAIRAGEYRAKEYDAHRVQVSNTRKLWKCEVEDLDKVPREYLIIQLNEKMVLAAARAGNTKIPGVKLWQEIAVAIGKRTAAPRTVLVEE